MIIDQEKNLNEEIDSNGLDSTGRDDQKAESFLEEIEKIDFTVKGIRCAAHNLQLAVMDALKDRKLKDCINKFCGIAKTLRNQNLIMLIRRRNLPLPILDCVTR